MANADLTVARLRELLHYNARTGEFIWLAKSGAGSKACAGEYAGSASHQSGYIYIRIMGHTYRAHRLAWLYVTDKWPADQIDHENGLRQDNRWANLREATHPENQQNQRKAQRNNKSGYLGVSAHGKRWQATITFKKVQFHIGTFDTAELAHAAYVLAKRSLHPMGTL